MIWADAEHKSKCPGCGEWIAEGDTIGLIDGEWCCEDCCEDELEVDPGRW